MSAKSSSCCCCCHYHYYFDVNWPTFSNQVKYSRSSL